MSGGSPARRESGVSQCAPSLGRQLALSSVADDPKRGFRTQLTAEFDWRTFDRDEDLGKIVVPYTLSRAADSDQTGTALYISELRDEAHDLNLSEIRTASIEVLSPIRSLFASLSAVRPVEGADEDPEFRLEIADSVSDDVEDVEQAILDAYVLRAELSLKGALLTFPWAW
jgi:hypothetical protein